MEIQKVNYGDEEIREGDLVKEVGVFGIVKVKHPSVECNCSSCAETTYLQGL
jgi:hypothetical protein